MKKTLLMVVFAAVCSMAQAKILRVNNTTGSGAPYTTIADALTAAAEEDTIMVDGSNKSYGGMTITKKLVVLGPGFWRSENGITAQGESDASFATIKINDTAPGTVLRGLKIETINVGADNVVINRCHVTSDINVKTYVSGHADNCIIHQNFIQGSISGFANNNYANFTQVTNNIFAGTNAGVVKWLNEANIAYNTFTIASVSYNFEQITGISGCRVEKNILGIAGTDIEGNTYIDNYKPNSPLFDNHDRDLFVKNQEFTEDIAAAIEGKGAFNGDDPYVISGIPVGPVIQDLTVPASVEQGNNLNITIKLGVQK